MDKGQLRSYGVGPVRLEVGIPENLSYKEKMVIAKEIYPIIDGEARKSNVTDVPVAFQSVGNYTDVIANSNGNLTENSSGNKSSDKSSAPGFGLFGSLACLYGGWRFRKK